MGAKEKDKSLLEIAVELFKQKKKAQKMLTIIKEVMEIKGVKQSMIKELAPQFILDFMQSGYFVYCGDDTWDLKEHQLTKLLDGGDYDDALIDEEAQNNELGSEKYNDEDVDDDDDDDEDDDDDDDDLEKEFENDEIDEDYAENMHITSEEDEQEDE